MTPERWQRVKELFDDAIASPRDNGTNLDGPFAGLPFLMKDLGPTMKGRLQEMGSLLMRGNRARNLLALGGDGEFFRINDGRDAGEAGLGFGAIHDDRGSNRGA